MSLRARRRWTRLLLLAAVLCVPTCSVAPSLLCEEAVARLARCCPGFRSEAVTCPRQPAVVPDFGGGWNCGPPGFGRADPTLLSDSEQQCVTAMPCADMARVCARFTERVQCKLQCFSDGDCGCSPEECRPFCVAGQCLRCTSAGGCDVGELCLDNGWRCSCAGADGGDGACEHPTAAVHPPCSKNATSALCL